jgi:hypothetical protein
MESQTRTRSFLSRLALPGMMSLILLAPAIAQADLMTTFDVTGSAKNFSPGKLGSCAAGATCPFSGMFTVDTTTGTVESSGLDIMLPGLPDFDTLSLSTGNSGGEWLIDATKSAGDDLSLTLQLACFKCSLVDYAGGPIATGEDHGNYVITSGTVAPVPEPTSLVLLGGVVCCLSFSLKRRFRKKSTIHTPRADRFADRGTI